MSKIVPISDLDYLTWRLGACVCVNLSVHDLLCLISVYSDLSCGMLSSYEFTKERVENHQEILSKIITELNSWIKSEKVKEM